MQENGERLSSRLTFFIKYFFPFLLIVPTGLYVATILATIHPSLGLFEKFLSLGAWLLFTGWLVQHSRSIRQVWLTKDSLLIGKNIEVTQEIPLKQVLDLKLSLLFNPKVIKVYVKQDSNSPQTFRFVAPYGFNNPFSEHPTVVKIKKAMNDCF